MKAALVTGGAGFIGSAIVRALRADPAVGRVAALDDLSTGRSENLAEFGASVDFHQADIRDRAKLETLFQGIDWVFHEAAVASVPRSIEAPLECHEINLTGTLNVLLAARDAGVERVVFASSSAVYGSSERLPKSEDMRPNPESPYGVHKLTAELYARGFNDNYGLETVALRYFNVYGPRQDPGSPYSGVLSLFCKAVLEDQAPTIYGDGEQSRDFVYVDDVAAVNLLAAKSTRAAGSVYNVGSGRRTTLNQVWSALRDLSGSALEAGHGPERPGDVKHSQAEISRANEELGFEPTVDLEAGLSRTLDWYRAAG